MMPVRRSSLEWSLENPSVALRTLNRYLTLAAVDSVSVRRTVRAFRCQAALAGQAPSRGWRALASSARAVPRGASPCHESAVHAF